MKNLTLKQLRYFEALAEQGHFGRASDVCAISQPALSMQIKELEEGLGLPLFERGARQIRLTSFGEDFALRVRGILQAVDELSDLARAARTGLTGRLRIGVIPTVAPYLLPVILNRFGRLYPELDVHVRETLTGRLIEELADGRLDAAIAALPVSEPWLTERPLFTEAMVLVRPSSQSGQPVPSTEDLRTMRLLLLEEGHCFRDQALSFCNLRSTRRQDGLDGSSLTTLVQMVGAGLGVTLIPEMAVAVETRATSVSIARFAEPQPSRTIGMLWRASSPLVAQFQEISGIVRDAAEDLRSLEEYP